MGRNAPIPWVPRREGCRSRSPAGCPRGHCNGRHQHPGEQRPGVTQRGSPTPPSAELQPTLVKPKSADNNLGKGATFPLLLQNWLSSQSLSALEKNQLKSPGASSPGTESGTEGARAGHPQKGPSQDTQPSTPDTPAKPWSSLTASLHSADESSCSKPLLPTRSFSRFQTKESKRIRR